jgi:hypothetical protein
MEQGQYKEDNFGKANPDGQVNSGGQSYSSGQPTQVAQAPFIPARAENGPAKQSQAKAIIVLLICILAVNVATFVTQNFMSPRAMNFSGNPGFGGGGIVTQGGNAGEQQQTAPNFEQQEEETAPDFGQQEEE